MNKALPAHWKNALAEAIRQEEAVFGCSRCELGIQALPDGYALMRESDGSYYYWLRWDGVESCIDWDRWSAYRGARADAGVGVAPHPTGML